jgi:hypothetical protein
LRFRHSNDIHYHEYSIPRSKHAALSSFSIASFFAKTGAFYFFLDDAEKSLTAPPVLK